LEIGKHPGRDVLILLLFHIKHYQASHRASPAVTVNVGYVLACELGGIVGGYVEWLGVVDLGGGIIGEVPSK